MKFERVPDELVLDASLSLGARGVYPVLLYLVWRGGGQADEEVELPPTDEIAAIIGCSRNSLASYLRVLETAGWVEVKRGSRSKPQRYVIRSACSAKSERQGGACSAKSELRVAQNPAHTPCSTDSSDEPCRTDLVARDPDGPKPVAASAVLGDLIDLARARGVDPPKRVVGHLARVVKELLDEGRAAHEIRAGFERMLERRIVQPALLPNMLVEAQLPRQRPGGRLSPDDLLRRAGQMHRESA